MHVKQKKKKKKLLEYIVQFYAVGIEAGLRDLVTSSFQCCAAGKVTHVNSCFKKTDLV